MLSGLRWIVSYIIATLAAAMIVAFYIASQNNFLDGPEAYPFLAWAAWLLIAILAAPLTIVMLGVPEIFDVRPNYIIWALAGAGVGVMSQYFWLATPAGVSLTGLLDGLPDYELISQAGLYRVTAAAGATGGFALAFLRRGWLR